MIEGNGAAEMSIGPYRLGSRIGHGGMGVVFDAVDTRLDRKVAIKMLNVVGSKRQDLTDRFEHEASELLVTDPSGIGLRFKTNHTR